MRTRYAALLVALLAVAAAAPNAGAARRLKPISAAAAFTLPSAKACVARHELTLLLRKVSHVTWTGATVKVNGTAVKTVKASQARKPIRLIGLPSGSYTLRITARAKGGRTAKATRVYRACGATPLPSHPTPTPTPAPTATPTSSPAPATGAAQPGSYTGSSNGYTLTFFVSPAGTRVQDVTVLAQLGCAPSHPALSDRFVVLDIPIAPDGSFTTTTHQTGVYSGTSAAFTYVFSGHFTATGATGTLRETIAFDNGVAYTCTTNDQAWSVTRDAQGTQTAAAPPAGGYTGSSNGYTLDFYVANDQQSLQDVTVLTQLACAPNHTGLTDRFVISTVPLAADGSFSATVAQPGVYSGTSATFTYVFSGHVHSVNAAGAERLAGTLRETIAFDNGTAFSCTTDDQYWSALRDAQGTQTAAAPPAGSYTGSSNGYTLGFYVANDQQSLQDVTVLTQLACAPNHTGLTDRFVISTVPLAADGSFNTTATQDGVWDGAPATFTYVFRGHVHSVNASGAERLAGVLRETIAFNDGTAYTCTTDDQYWSALRDAQGAQSGTPAAGSYTGSSNGYTLSFTVSADKQHLQTVDVQTQLGCTPAHPGLSDHLTIADVPVAGDGSFNTTTPPAPGTVSGAPATFTYTFRGHVHGIAANGATRLAGVLREDIAFNNGTAFSCTTDDQYWSAAH